MVIKGQELKRRFLREGRGTNEFFAVERADIVLRTGCFTQLVGSSGSGKTTLINMLAGLLKPSSGKVYLDETDLYALSDQALSRLRNRRIGVAPQGQTGLSGLTVLENVLAPARMYGGRPDVARACELMDLMGIDALANVYSNELSGGEARRMAIARALINKPQIIIADEPTADLDSDAAGAVLELLKSQAAQGCAVLMVTHEHDALRYADEVYRMEKGVLKRE